MRDEEEKQRMRDVLVACVSMLISDGHEGTGIVDDALALLEGRSGETSNGRKWSCESGRITWHT